MRLLLPISASLTVLMCMVDIDYIVRYAPNQRENYSILDYKDIIDEILKLLIQNGKGIECNTAGFKYGLGVPNPRKLCVKALS